MQIPTIIIEGGPHDDDELDPSATEALRLEVVAWASEAAWEYVCAVGCACDSVRVQYGTDGFEWIVFVVDGEEFTWNPDDGIGPDQSELGLSAALAARCAALTEERDDWSARELVQHARASRLQSDNDRAARAEAALQDVTDRCASYWIDSRRRQGLNTEAADAPEVCDDCRFVISACVCKAPGRIAGGG